MTIFFLFILIPAVVFYGCVLLNFIKELLLVRRELNGFRASAPLRVHSISVASDPIAEEKSGPRLPDFPSPDIRGAQAPPAVRVLSGGSSLRSSARDSFADQGGRVRNGRALPLDTVALETFPLRRELSRIQRDPWQVILPTSARYDRLIFSLPLAESFRRRAHFAVIREDQSFAEGVNADARPDLCIFHSRIFCRGNRLRLGM